MEAKPCSTSAGGCSIARGSVTLHSPAQKKSLRQVEVHAPTLACTGMHVAPGEFDFAFVANAFHAWGGFRIADDVAADLRAASCGDVGQVARWIVSRQVLNVYWRGTYWIPYFQFAPSTMSLKPAVSAVLRELAPVLDDWDICKWFAAANGWLGNQSPAQALGPSPAEVFHAARAHRFIFAS